jgi:hypothetical protein
VTAESVATCATCGQSVLIAYQIDGARMFVDAEPAADGELVGQMSADGDLTCFFGMTEEQDYTFWSVPLDSPRYQRHTCRPAGREW